MLKRFLEDESGATVPEYGVMLGLIVVVAIFAISQLGENIAATFTTITSDMGIPK